MFPEVCTDLKGDIRSIKYGRQEWTKWSLHGDKDLKKQDHVRKRP